MTPNPIMNLQRELDGKDSMQVLEWAFSRYAHDKVGLATSLGAEDQVLTDMAVQVTSQPIIFTLDTGRLFSEAYDTIDRTRKRYGIAIEVLFPDRSEVEAMVREHGPNLFYESRELRKLCCQVRKVNVLRKRLAGLDLWITGLRREQSATRESRTLLEWDETFGLLKLSPLLDWSTSQVWAYIREHEVPYNLLHDQGYPSIGCAPCTRAVATGEDSRAGRWWWEDAEPKECGLHWQDGKPMRAEDVK